MSIQNPITIGLQSDPLFDLEILQRIADHGWLLPSNRLAPLFNISPRYLNKHQSYIYCGFTASKECYVRSKILWRVLDKKS
jgi:hypothetical protein